jgi:hypothetical protein
VRAPVVVVARGGGVVESGRAIGRAPGAFARPGSGTTSPDVVVRAVGMGIVGGGRVVRGIGAAVVGRV